VLDCHGGVGYYKKINFEFVDSLQTDALPVI